MYSWSWRTSVAVSCIHYEPHCFLDGPTDDRGLSRGHGAPRYLLRDRDGIDANDFRERVKGMGIKEVLAVPRSPWQNPFA